MSAMRLSMDGKAGLRGWQWVFIIGTIAVKFCLSFAHIVYRWDNHSSNRYHGICISPTSLDFTF